MSTVTCVPDFGMRGPGRMKQDLEINRLRAGAESLTARANAG